MARDKRRASDGLGLPDEGLDSSDEARRGADRAGPFKESSTREEKERRKFLTRGASGEDMSH